MNWIQFGLLQQPLQYIWTLSLNHLLFVIFHLFRTNGYFEKYHKSYFCPIPGCCSSKPIKKLSNHLASVHRLSTKEWLQHLAEARRSQLDPLPKGLSTLSLKNQYIVQPKGKPKEGSTRSFPNYSPDTPELFEFSENLTGFDSGHKSLPDTRQISSDIGKFFAHVYKAKIRWISYFN